MNSSKTVPSFYRSNIANKIKLYRQIAGLTQEEVGKALDIKYQQYQRYELGKYPITADRLYALSLVFNVPVQAFFDDLMDERSKCKI